jgi:hypothetical protein
MTTRMEQVVLTPKIVTHEAARRHESAVPHSNDVAALPTALE